MLKSRIQGGGHGVLMPPVRPSVRPSPFPHPPSLSLPLFLSLSLSLSKVRTPLPDGHRCSKPAALLIQRRPAQRIKDPARAELIS